MAEEAEVAGQETTGDEFDGIDEEALENFLSGNTDEVEVHAPEVDQDDDDNAGDRHGLSAEQIQSIISQGIKEGVQAAGGNRSNQDQNGNQQQGDFFKQYEDALRKDYTERMGLNEQGAKFMTDSVMAGVKPIINMMARGFQALSQKDEQIQTDTALSEVDRTLNSLLDDKGIDDTGDRQDIMDLAKLRASRVENPTTETLRIEFEKVARRYLEQKMEEDEEGNETFQTARRRTPPVVRGTKIGFDDVVKKVVRSKDPRDDIGGSRFTSLVERMIRAGQGGGQ